MAQPVIITTAEPPEPDVGASFAAGVAAATAAQAAADAQEATQVAESAETTASVALEAASDAEYTAAMAHDEIRALELRVMDALGAIVESLDLAAAPPVDTMAPEVIVSAGDVEVTDEGTKEEPKSKPKPKRERGGFGWDGWFGKR